MVIVEYNNIELDYCTGCKGVWFDSGELELLLESVKLDNYQHFLGDITDKQEATSAEKKRKCPICLSKMKKVFIDDSGEIMVDICRNGHGIWFDGQEVKHLLDILAKESRGEKGPPKEVMDFLGDMFKY